MAQSFKQLLVTQALSEGFVACRICRPWDVPQVPDRLNSFLQKGYHGQMGWLAERTHWRGDPAALWPEAKCFKPERFERSERPAQPPLTYVPFGGGPRNCIGATFAQIEAKVVLARILQLFDLRLISKNVRPKMGATLEPRPGVIMQISRRL